MESNKMNVASFLHGADYNPEQWLDRPDILAKDIELMKEANCNVVSIGMFSWAMLEPVEGVYNFDWMANVIDRLYENGIYTILSTPSGARPNWLAQKYPEVLRVEKNRVRNLFGLRHNHCYTSPIYRDKVAQINGELAKRFANHPGVILWHLSNEYGGECHCPLCQEAFRNWLKEKYKTLEDFNGVSIAAQSAPLQEGYVKDQLPNAQINTIASLSDGVLRVQSGKSDALAISYSTGEQYVNANKDLVMSSVLFEGNDSEGTMIGIVKGETELVEAINEIIQEVKEQGLYQQWEEAYIAYAKSLGIE